MNGFIELSPDRRRTILEEAQARLGLPAISLEKDFWVCWILRELSRLPQWNESLTFKGGTSLSKCWNLIHRFSEDIDLVIDRGFIGFAGAHSPEEAPSRKKRNQALLAMNAVARERIRDHLRPMLADRIRETIRNDWRLFQAPEHMDPDGQTLLFEYPTVLPSRDSYVTQQVRIEMGARSDHEPVIQVEIQPYLFDVFSEVLGESRFPIMALAPERTFWEKAMLLHEETYRPPDSRRPARRARHYYDLWCLILEGVASRAMEAMEIFNRAAFHREVYFRRSWVDYGTLTRGRLRLIPLKEQEAEWQRDYRAMRSEMFFGDVPEFDEVLRVVEAFQKAFNGG